MQTQWLTIQTADGPMRAYSAHPDGAGPHPGIVVVQEAFGVDPYVRSVCDRLADEGFSVIAPELFHRTGQHVEVAYDDMPRAMSLIKALTQAQIEDDCEGALAQLRATSDVDPKRLGVIGFCFGGYCAVLTGLTTAVAAVVAFYPGGLCEPTEGRQTPPLLDRIPQMRAATFVAVGEKDERITAANVAQISAALDESECTHRVTVYPDAGHAFHNQDRPKLFHPERAEEAWHAATAWLREMLA